MHREAHRVFFIVIGCFLLVGFTGLVEGRHQSSLQAHTNQESSHVGGSSGVQGCRKGKYKHECALCISVAGLCIRCGSQSTRRALLGHCHLFMAGRG